MSGSLDENKSQPAGQIVKERRKFARLNINVQVNYNIITEQSAKNTTETKNIAAGGICLLVYSPIKEGNIVSLDIFLPDNSSVIHAKGKVVWVKIFTIANEKNVRYDAGIEFTEIVDGDRKKIDEYVFKLK